MSQYINLYDPALRRQRPVFSAGQLAAALLIVAAGFTAGAALLGSEVRTLTRESAALDAQLVAQREQLAEAGRALAASKPDAALAAQLTAAEATLAARREVIGVLEGGALGNKTGFSGYLRAFSHQTMHGLWLTGFEISGGGSEMAIHGRALEASLLPRYIRRLNGEQAFRGRNFAALKMAAGEDEPPQAKAGAKGDPVAEPVLRYVEFKLATAKANIQQAEPQP